MKLNHNKLGLILGSLFSINAYTAPIPLEQEESQPQVLVQEDFSNGVDVISDDEEIKLLKNSYISPYNYLQDPISLNLGYSQITDSPNGSYHGGISTIFNMNNQLSEQRNLDGNTNIAEIWGQTGRLGGFALGGSATAVLNFKQVGYPDVYTTTGILVPTQAYIDYQYRNKLDIVAGNILITTPWVNSFGSNPWATYAVGNNSYQGVLVNIQALDSLLIKAFSAWSYLQYPNNWPNQQTYYNTIGGNLAGIGGATTAGPSGLGLIWNPVNSYTGQLWLYNFASYASMAYLDNAYNVKVSDFASFDFGLQAYTQASSSTDLTNTVSLPGQTTPAGVISSNGVGAKIAVNLGNNTTSLSANSIFGPNGSFLNGGMVTPYSYGMETDPLYTTPALTSLAELGSGYAYTLRNSTSFMDKSLKFNLSMSQFFVNQVYSAQPNQVTEYDAALMYRIGHTNMNVWSRLVYVQQPEYAGGNILQPRLIFNWTF
jgi:hypothetical protein